VSKLIEINSVSIPTPSDFNVSVMDITKAERNANGNMVLERITTKRKLELSWKYLSQADVASLLTKVSPVSFSVTYPDPQTGASRTGTFYAGDRGSGFIDYQNSVPRYKDIKFNLIEV
jgi:hypothetical protein